ncbi:hypothetical protein ACP3P8_20070, partial [Pseudomonas aeruginosa]
MVGREHDQGSHESKPETTAAPNFLRQIVQADLDAG